MPTNSQRHHGQVNGSALIESDQRLNRCQSIDSWASLAPDRGVDVVANFDTNIKSR